MKKYLILFILISSVCGFGFRGQMSLSSTYDKNEQAGTELNNWFMSEIGKWTLYNHTRLSYDPIENQISSYYAQNYASTQMHLNRMSQNWDINLSGGINASYGDNHSTELAGSSELYERLYNYNLGGSAVFDNSHWYLKLKTSYVSTEFEDEGSLEKVDEHDLFYYTAGGLWLTEDILLSVHYDQFEDLNENSSYDYADFYLRGRLSKKLNYIHYLTQELRLGYSDLYENNSTYLLTKTRLSSRLSGNWTLLNVLAARSWVDEDNSELLLDESWIETDIRRILNVSAQNQISYVQTGALYDFYNEILTINLAAKYHFNHLKIYTSNQLYTGDARWRDYQVMLGAGWEIFSSFSSLNYQIMLRGEPHEDNTIQHQLLLEYTY